MIYIDGVEYLKSDNEHVRESVINYLNNWNITVSTSGTTGKPKTYQHSEKLMRQVAEYNAEYFMLDSNSSMMALYNPRGIGFTSMSLYPCHVAKCDTFIETTVANLPDRIREVQPTNMLILPNVWKTWHRHKKWKNLDLSCMKQMQVGSDITPTGLMEDLRARGAQQVNTGYGSTEVPPIIMSTERQDIYKFSDINPNIDFKFVEHDDGSTEFYCKYKEQTEWWDSGDLVEFNSADEFRLSGRRYNAFKMENCGDRVYPEQIEKVAIENGASLALCRKVAHECVVYYTGDLDVENFTKQHKCAYEIKPIKVNEIKVDDNLRKISRNQEFV